MQTLQGCIQAVKQQLASQQLVVKADCRSARAALQTATSRLQLELSSAGNIWLEEGCPGDVWMQSCQELVRSSCRAGTSPARRSLQGDGVQVRPAAGGLVFLGPSWSGSSGARLAVIMRVASTQASRNGGGRKRWQPVHCQFWHLQLGAVAQSRVTPAVGWPNMDKHPYVAVGWPNKDKHPYVHKLTLFLSGCSMTHQHAQCVCAGAGSHTHP
jgi:hypothetical protein